MKNAVMTAALAVAFCACDGGGASQKNKQDDAENKKNNRVENLQSEVMELHDEHMPKMDDIHTMTEELESKLDSIAGSDEIDEAVSAELEQIRNQLEMSGERMMEWMRNFKKPGDELPEDEVIEYLEQQKKMMRDVGEAMDKSMNKADSALSTL